MLPRFLYGSYKRYKSDTEHFTQWLVETARKCGYEAESQSSSTNPQKKNKSSQTPSKNKVALRDFGALAQTIAESALDVPPAVLSIAKRAISSRKRCAAWFLGQTESMLENRTHAHFISVMEEVCELLERKARKSLDDSMLQPQIASKSEDDQSVGMWLNNQFAALAVEEPRELQETQPQARQIVEYEIEEYDDDEEEIFLSQMFFNAFCLFEDLHNMRAFIAQTWSEYRDGKIDLMNAAVVTDTALQLAKQLVQELVANWPEIQDDLTIQELVYVTACSARGKSSADQPDPGIPYNLEMADVADWCYLPTFILLVSFQDVLQPGEVPVYKKGYFGVYDSRAKRDKMTASQRFHEDKIILLQLLPDFSFLQRIKLKPPVEDEITRGVIDFVKNKKIPLWLSFAAQIFLDVHHELRYSNAKAFGDLRLSGLRIKKIIEEYWELSKSFPKPQFWPKEGESIIKHIHSTVEAWVLDDPILSLKTRGFPPNLVPEQEKHDLLRQHPVLCGLTMFHLNLRMQEIGLCLINQWYDVVQMAYLYNLVLQTGVTTLSWPDISSFISMHGEEHIFIGPKPNTAQESFKKLQIVTGISSASNFARDSRNRGRWHRPDGKSRLIQPTTAVANIFRDRYCAAGRTKISIENIDKLLDEISQSTSAKDNEVSGPILLRHKWTKSHRIATLQLLAAIKDALYVEEPKLLFNYFGMHKRCIELLRLIKAKEHPKFVQYFTEAYLPDETLIPNLVVLIHQIAQGSALAGHHSGLLPPDQPQGSRILFSCGEVMEEYLVTNGDVACKELKVFCKNKSLGDTPKAPQQEMKDAYWFGLEEAYDPKVFASLTTGILIA